MKKTVYVAAISVVFVFLNFAPKVNRDLMNIQDPTFEDIVNSYKKAISQWPKATIDPEAKWSEFSPIKRDVDFFKNQDKPEVILGKMLFFDPKLSKSDQISCSSCHDPEMGWTDRRRVSLGNDHLMGTRNTPTILNIAERKSFFWDGRASTLEDQAISPIAAHHEMDMDPSTLPDKFEKFKNYKKLFKDAFGTESVTFNRITTALAAFQKTIKSQPSRFDQFLEGNYKAMTDQEIYGMHIFRTKARCMNCHNGQYLTDESFHNIGLTYYKRQYQDLGLYDVTKKAEDVGKFRTPQLRDLNLTRPWMHNGLFDDLEGIINIYNSGMHMIDPKPEQKLKDPMYPVTDPLMKKLDLTVDEKKALILFLEALNGTKFKMRRPDFPIE